MVTSCAVCSRSFDAKRANALYCGDTCRKRSQRAGTNKPNVPSDPDTSRVSSGLADVVRRDLEAADRLDTFHGQQALAIVDTIFERGTTSASVPALMKSLDVAMASALEGVTRRKLDALDELEARRLAKVASA